MNCANLWSTLYHLIGINETSSFLVGGPGVGGFDLKGPAKKLQYRGEMMGIAVLP